MIDGQILTAAFLLTAGVIFGMASPALYMLKTMIPRRKTYAFASGITVFALFMVSYLFLWLELPLWLWELHAFVLMVAPWFTGLWFIQLWLIEDRRQADRIRQPTTTQPARRVVEQPEA